MREEKKERTMSNPKDGEKQFKKKKNPSFSSLPSTQPPKIKKKREKRHTWQT